MHRPDPSPADTCGKQGGPPFTVLVLTGHDLLSAGLGALLTGLGHEVATSLDSPADIAIVDLSRHRPPYPAPPEGIPTLALVSYQNHALVTLLRAGYRGYLRAGDSPDVLDKALATVCRGEVWAERHITAAALKGPPAKLLTFREDMVLELLSGGLSNQEIAERLGISVSTVKAHLASLFEKFGVKSRLELVVSYIKNPPPLD